LANLPLEGRFGFAYIYQPLYYADPESLLDFRFSDNGICLNLPNGRDDFHKPGQVAVDSVFAFLALAND
jgi:hypothetical protein